MATHSAEAHRPGSPSGPPEGLPRPASAPQFPSYTPLYAGPPLSLPEDSPLPFNLFDNFSPGSNLHLSPRALGGLSPRALGNLSPRALVGDLSPRDLGGSFSPGEMGGGLSPRALGGDLTPRDLGGGVSPGEIGGNLSPRALGSNLSPGGLSPLPMEALTRSPGQYPEADAIRRHERYPEMVDRLMDCLKVGASENEIRRLDAHRRCLVEESRGRVAGQGGSAREPGLDKVMVSQRE